MAPLESIEDVGTLRQVVRLLDQENARLHERLAGLTKQLAELSGKKGAEQLEFEIARLKEQSDKFQKLLFAATSERRRKDRESKEKKPQTGHGPREQEQLPRVEQAHLLAADQCACPACGGTLEEMSEQFETSEEVTVVERKFQLVRHLRQKYRCRCNGAIVTAPTPPRLIPGGRYSLDFAVEVAAAKYLEHLPLDRQRRTMEGEGLIVETQTLFDQVHALARSVEHNYTALGPLILQEPVVGADETTWPLLEKGGSKNWWMWCITSPSAVQYRIAESRSAAAAEELLQGFRGTLVVDGFEAYVKAARASPGRQLAYCWAHARRNFFETEHHYPKECGEILDLMSALFKIEHEVPEGLSATEAAAALAELRRVKSTPLIAEMAEWMKLQTGLPEGSFRKAVQYLGNHWQGLTLFLGNPQIPLTNNASERALRGPVVGRKNHYGSKSRRGTEVAAIFYSLLETAKLCGVNGKDYLRQAAMAALTAPGTVLLPHMLRQ